MVYWKWRKLSPDQLPGQILYLVPVCYINYYNYFVLNINI